MMSALAVIGANYGDEGKGACVDRAVRLLGGDAVVVRSNGGAQAGHTVATDDGRRHVFHHVGSGAFAGAATHLSRFFVHHPMTFMEEAERLHRLGARVEMSSDPRAYVTTPWDMMVNQVAETARGGGRHGSCGYGFGETVGRNEETGFGLTFGDLAGGDLRRRLRVIRDNWLPRRLETLGLVADPETEAAIHSEALLDRYLDDCAQMASAIASRPDAYLGCGAPVVFEGAQGLLLDQKGADFPHVTRSNTGIENMAAIAREAGLDRIEATYATRCYLSRHGAGPMPDERDISDLFDVVDETNAPNPWQKAIRFGLLDPDRMVRTIRSDVAKASGVQILVDVSVCCLDQARAGRVAFLWEGALRGEEAMAFADVVGRLLGARRVTAVSGVSASHAVSDLQIA